MAGRVSISLWIKLFWCRTEITHNFDSLLSSQHLQSSAPFILAVFAHVIDTHAVPEDKFHITSCDFSGKHYFLVLGIQKVTRIFTVFNVDATGVFSLKTFEEWLWQMHVNITVAAVITDNWIKSEWELILW